MIKRTLYMGLTILVTVGVSAACSSSSTKGNTAASDAPKKQANQDPVTLKLYTFQNFNTDEIFNDYIGEAVKKKYPYITVEWIKSQSNGLTLPDMIASQGAPDLINGWQGEVKTLENYNLLGDMTPLAKENNIDLNRFEPVILDAMKALSDKGYLYAIPYQIQFNALFYNKEIFDKFGVSYPKDGMTWEDTMDIGRKVSRQDGNTLYRGLAYEHISRLSFALSPNVVDPKTQKANVNNDTWKRVFQLGKDIISIPGNKPAKVDSGDTDAFWKDKSIAMYATINQLERTKDAIDAGLKLGVAQYPSFKEQPNTYGMVDAHYIVVNPASKNKDAAMKVVEVMTSDEVQLNVARKYGKLSPLKNPEMKKQLAGDMTYLKGIDLQSIFKSKPASGTNLSKYYSDSRKKLMSEYILFADSKEDLNTAMRNAEEAINKYIDSEKGKGN